MTIRKAIPLLWRYLVVVVTSCLLALLISSAHAGKAVPGYDSGRGNETPFQPNSARMPLRDLATEQSRRVTLRQK
jgi:hypothetical protein